MNGIVYVVGLGPGRAGLITPEALEVIQKVQVAIGQPECLDLIENVTSGKEIVFERQSPLERSRLAVEKARSGKDVALVSLGDPGTFAIASTFLGYIKDNHVSLDVRIIPGLNLASYSASLLGAPLGNDWASITLTDQGIPWEVTRRRLEAAAEADFVIAIYNPIGKLGQCRLKELLGIISSFRIAETPVGLVSHAASPHEKIIFTTLAAMEGVTIPVDTLVIIGNSQSFVREGKFTTPRFYKEGTGY
jgi:precorrin-3B C17-methyltransferase